jgi:hypothetical protein
MVAALEEWGVQVSRSDISRNQDFFHFKACDADGIVTNPPYSAAVRFIEHALALTKSGCGFVAMLLLRTDFDHAKSRQHFFGTCPQFAQKVVLTKRIRWFEESTGQPSFNHAWYIWNWKHRGPPTLAKRPSHSLSDRTKRTVHGFQTRGSYELGIGLSAMITKRLDLLESAAVRARWKEEQAAGAIAKPHCVG